MRPVLTKFNKNSPELDGMGVASSAVIIKLLRKHGENVPDDAEISVTVSSDTLRLIRLAA